MGNDALETVKYQLVLNKVRVYLGVTRKTERVTLVMQY